MNGSTSEQGKSWKVAPSLYQLDKMARQSSFSPPPRPVRLSSVKSKRRQTAAGATRRLGSAHLAAVSSGRRWSTTFRSGLRPLCSPWWPTSTCRWTGGPSRSPRSCRRARTSRDQKGHLRRHSNQDAVGRESGRRQKNKSDCKGYLW
jgi:hypothetical protein